MYIFNPNTMRHIRSKVREDAQRMGSMLGSDLPAREVYEALFTHKPDRDALLHVGAMFNSDTSHWYNSGMTINFYGEGRKFIIPDMSPKHLTLSALTPESRQAVDTLQAIAERWGRSLKAFEYLNSCIYNVKALNYLCPWVVDYVGDIATVIPKGIEGTEERKSLRIVLDCKVPEWSPAMPKELLAQCRDVKTLRAQMVLLGEYKEVPLRPGMARLLVGVSDIALDPKFIEWGATIGYDNL